MSKPKMNAPAPVAPKPLAPVPFTPVEIVTTTIKGTCNSCGRKNVLVRPGNDVGYGRCVDSRMCEAARFYTANPHKAHPSAEKVIVLVYRHHRPHFFRREFSTTYTPEGKKVATSHFYWELVPERSRATRMKAQEANALVDAWAARAIEEG